MFFLRFFSPCFQVIHCHVSLPPSSSEPLLLRGADSCTHLGLLYCGDFRMVWCRYIVSPTGLSPAFFSCLPASIPGYPPHPDTSIPISFVCDHAWLFLLTRPDSEHPWGYMIWNEHRSKNVQILIVLCHNYMIFEQLPFLIISALKKQSSYTTP